MDRMFRNVGTTYEDGTDKSVPKTSAHKIQKPGNHPKEAYNIHTTAKVCNKK